MEAVQPLSIAGYAVGFNGSETEPGARGPEAAFAEDGDDGWDTHLPRITWLRLVPTETITMGAPTSSSMRCR